MSEILTPEQVRKRFGRMFAEGLITMVDEGGSRVRIIERCSARGPVEWDAVNRLRAGGAIRRIEVNGCSLIMDADIGEGEVHFGPVSADTGGQALKAVSVEKGRVTTSWIGLAGASIGVGACLPQAKGVIETEFENLAELGGTAEVKVRISTPEMRHLIVGLDDTDSDERGATWALGLRLANEMPHGVYIQHKIIQLNHRAPHKTTNCTATGVSFAVPPDRLPDAVEFIRKFVLDGSYSDQTSLAIYTGLDVPRAAVEFGIRAKENILTQEEAEIAADDADIDLLELTGPRGKIGALAAIGCFELGLSSAGLPEDHDSFRSGVVGFR